MHISDNKMGILLQQLEVYENASRDRSKSQRATCSSTIKRL